MGSIPPAGVTPASGFAVNEAGEVLKPLPILADKISVETGEVLSLLEGYDPLDAFVIEAMRVERDSGAAVQGIGQRFKSVTHVEDTNPQIIDSLTREAFRPVISDGLLELEPVKAKANEKDGAQLEVEIEYKDATAQDDTPKNQTFTF